MRHYCHNCHYWSDLPDLTHCAWCIEFWVVHHRFPVKSDRPRPTDSLHKIYATMGWEYPA